MPAYDFRQKLKEGKQGEQTLKDVLERVGIPCWDGDGRAADLFFAHSGKTYSVEVKYDLYQARSGNIALEFFNSKQNKPSGILASQTDLWAYILADSVWICPRSSLFRFYKTAHPLRILEKAGDDNASICLYKDKDFLKTFTRIDQNPSLLFSVLENL